MIKYSILPCLLLCSFFTDISGQIVDSFIVKTVFTHEVIDGKLTTKKTPEIQHTYQQNAQVYRIIKYNLETVQPEVITYFHYNKDGLLVEENINLDNELLSYEQYQYKKGILKSSSRYSVNNTSTSLISRKKYTKKDNVETIRYYNKNNKLIKTQTKTFNENKLSSDLIILSKNNDTTSINKVFEYLDNGQIKAIKRIYTMKNGSEAVESSKFSYHNGNLSKIEVRDANNKVLKRTNYMYFANGALSSIGIVDGNNNYISNQSMVYKFTDLTLNERKIPDIVKIK